MLSWRGLLGLLILVTLGLQGVATLSAVPSAPSAEAAAPHALTPWSMALDGRLFEVFETGSVGIFTGPGAVTDGYNSYYAGEINYGWGCNPWPKKSKGLLNVLGRSLWTSSKTGESYFSVSRNGATARPPQEDGYGCPPFSHESRIVTRSSVGIPRLTEGITLLHFWYHYRTEAYGGASSVDVAISADNGYSWTSLEGWVGSAGWQEKVFNLTQYAAGSSIKLGFGGALICDLECSYDLVVDDVQITVYPDGYPTPTPTPIYSPTPLPTRTPTNTPSPTNTPHAGQFQDVPPPQPFYAYIECMGLYQIISGYPCGGPFEPCVPDTKPYFRPGNPVTRGQVSKMLSLSVGWTDPVPSTQQTFEDVAPISTFWVWIEQLAGRGTIGGYPCGGAGEPCVDPHNRPYFRPNANLTRGQFAKIAAQAAGYRETPTGQTFADVPSATTFWVWVEQVAGHGVVGGYPCGGVGEPCLPPSNRPYYRPGSAVTRGQTAKILTNTFLPGCPSPTPTVTPTETRVPLDNDTPTPSSTVPPTHTPTPTITGTPPTATPTTTHDVAVRAQVTTTPYR
jgi:hypothetical protein